MSNQFKKPVLAAFAVFGLYVLGYAILLNVHINPDASIPVYISYIFYGARVLIVLLFLIIIWTVWRFFNQHK